MGIQYTVCSNVVSDLLSPSPRYGIGIGNSLLYSESMSSQAIMQ